MDRQVTVLVRVRVKSRVPLEIAMISQLFLSRASSKVRTRSDRRHVQLLRTPPDRSQRLRLTF